MALYKSKIQQIPASAEAVFDKLSDMSNLKSVLANVPESAIPADKRELFDAVRVSENSISFPAGPVGALTLRMARKERPGLIELIGEGAPVALTLSLEITPTGASSSEGCVAIDIAIPAMLKPMIGGTLQKMADQFGDVLGKLRYD